jgi:hypothetical protein
MVLRVISVIIHRTLTYFWFIANMMAIYTGFYTSGKQEILSIG